MSRVYKPEYVVTIKGSGGEYEAYRTDDVEGATKNAEARGLKVVSTELSKRAAQPDVRKAYAGETARVSAILKKAAKNPANVTPDEIEIVRKFSQNYAQAMAEYDDLPGQRTKDNLSTPDYWAVKAAEDASETDASLAQMLEDAKTSGNATRIQMIKARMRARAEARGRADARAKSASVEIPNGQPRSAGSAGLGDTTGPAFEQGGQGEMVEAFADSYPQLDKDSFAKWLSSLDLDQVRRQGYSDEELFKQYAASMVEPSKLMFGDTVHVRTMTQEPGSDRIQPKGGQ